MLPLHLERNHKRHCHRLGPLADLFKHTVRNTEASPKFLSEPAIVIHDPLSNCCLRKVRLVKEWWVPVFHWEKGLARSWFTRWNCIVSITIRVRGVRTMQIIEGGFIEDPCSERFFRVPHNPEWKWNELAQQEPKTSHDTLSVFLTLDCAGF